MVSSGVLDSPDGNALSSLAGKRDAQTLAAFEVYLTDKDEEDFADTLQRIARRALNAAASPAVKRPSGGAATPSQELTVAARMCEAAFTREDGYVEPAGVQAAQLALDGSPAVLRSSQQSSRTRAAVRTTAPSLALVSCITSENGRPLVHSWIASTSPNLQCSIT